MTEEIGTTQKPIGITRCPLLSYFIKHGVKLEPVYLSATADTSMECWDTSVANVSLMIPNEWTIEQGKEWLKSDAKKFLEQEALKNT